MRGERERVARGQRSVECRIVGPRPEGGVLVDGAEDVGEALVFAAGELLAGAVAGGSFRLLTQVDRCFRRLFASHSHRQDLRTHNKNVVIFLLSREIEIERYMDRARKREREWTPRIGGNQISLTLSPSPKSKLQ